MFKNNENKNSEIKIIKISSKLFERNPSIESLYAKPRRLNLEERENFLAASTSPKIFNRYERRQELNQIIKLHHQANEKVKNKPEYIHKLVSILKFKRKDYQEKRKNLANVYDKANFQKPENSPILTNNKISESMPNIYCRFPESENKIKLMKFNEQNNLKSSSCLNNGNLRYSSPYLENNKSDNGEFSTEKINFMHDEKRSELLLKSTIGKIGNFKCINLEKTSLKLRTVLNKDNDKCFKRLKFNSDRLDPSFARFPLNGKINASNYFNSSDKIKNINRSKESKENEEKNKIRLVDIFYYDKKKWKEQQQPKQEKSLQNILIRKSTFSYLNEMLGEWGSKGKLKK